MSLNFGLCFVLSCEAYASFKVTEDDKEEVVLRLEGKVKEQEEGLLCDKHHKQYFRFYKLRQTECSDPFKTHSQKMKTRLSEITLNDVNTFKQKLIPGKKVCGACRTRLTRGDFMADISLEHISCTESSEELLSQSQDVQTLIEPNVSTT